MNLTRLFIFSAIITIIPTIYCQSQATDSVTAVASPHIKIGGARHFWMGSNYRREWRMPVRMPVINLATEQGGLTVVKRGGGKQTKSLRVADPTGKEYNFRSIQKFITSATLPADLQSEAAEDLVADGVSASYPYAALSVPILAEAAGIPYLKVKLVSIPDDARLDSFRKEFANLPAYFEERLPANVSKGYDTEEVVEKLQEDNDNDVDQNSLLKARILDMFIMDLDRHEGQWEWGAIDKDKGKTYFPIPKDRDQAFYINRGVLPGMIKWPWLVPQLQGLDVKARNIKRFNWAARNLDRYFLNGLSEQDWQTAADEFVTKMTDDVIDRAMAQQPPELRDLHGPWIAQTLKERRKYIVGEVMEYYRFLAEDVNVVASNKKELFDIKFEDDGTASLQVYKITKEGEQSIKMFDRRFNPQHTKEIRIYGLGGEDKFVVNGNKDKIKLRLIGGPGVDEFTNATNAHETAIVYDSLGEGNKITGQFKNRMVNDTIAHYYNRLGYKYNTVAPFISVNYNRDDGLFLGASLKVTHHGFRKEPYKNLHEITINHALGTQAWNFRYYAEFISTFSKNSDLLFDADIKAPNNTTNFFGYGENSVYNKNNPEDFRFYRARYQLGDISLLLRHNFSKKVIMTLGPTFQFYELDSADSKNRVRNIVMTGTNGLNPATLFSNQSYIGGRFSLTADTRNNRVLPQRGINWISTVRYLSGMNDASYDVTQINSEFSFYVSLIPKRLIWANRIGGGTNLGDFEFYQAQYLGSEDNLRGYRKYRFAGESKFFNQTELRLAVANFRTYLFPGSLGILAFYDAGRIWADGSANSKWLSGYGGGLWISPLRRLVITLVYAASEEDKLPLIGLGWKF
jgi:hypothetical protein